MQQRIQPDTSELAVSSLPTSIKGSFRRRLTVLFLVSALHVSSLGCFTLMGGEQAVGDGAARQVESEMGIVDDPALAGWVEEIGRRLVAVSDEPDRAFRFQVVDMAAPNAFALPGGYIYVSRGLLALINSEDELAGVIGHEIGHVTGSHASRRITLAAPFKIMTGLTSWATGILTPRLGEAIRSGGDLFTEGLVVAPYGRQQERDADRIGLKLSAAAGWDPEGLPDFLQTLGRDEALRIGGQRDASWLDSHPATPERVDDTQKGAASLIRADAAGIATTRDQLLAKLDGLLVGDDIAGGVVVDELFIQPTLGFTLGIPSGWQHANEPTQFMTAPKEGGAAIILRIAGEGDDPKLIEPKLEEALGSKVEMREVSLGGLPAIRTRLNQNTRDGAVTLDLTFFSVAGLILEVTGIAPERDFGRWEPLLDDAVSRIRPPGRREIADLREKRLRLAEARTGESLEGLAERADSAWAADRIAVANGVEADSPLAPGFGVKIVREEPYVADSE